MKVYKVEVSVEMSFEDEQLFCGYYTTEELAKKALKRELESIVGEAVNVTNTFKVNLHTKYGDLLVGEVKEIEVKEEI